MPRSTVSEADKLLIAQAARCGAVVTARWAAVAVGSQLGSQLGYPATRRTAGMQAPGGGRRGDASGGLAG